MTGKTINRMENLPPEMRKLIRTFLTTRTDRQSYAACSDLIASEMFNSSTCNLLRIEKTNKRYAYKIRIGMEGCFDTIVTFKNVENNCEIKWRYFSLLIDNKFLIIENSNSEKEVVRLFEECLKKYGQTIETLVLKKIDFNFKYDPLLRFKKLRQLKIETSNDKMAKYFIEKIQTRVILEVRPIGNNFSNEIVSKSTKLERINLLKFFSKTITDEQFRRIFSYVQDIEISMGNITIDLIRRIIITNLERFRPVEWQLSIIATSPFKLSDFKEMPESVYHIDYVPDTFGNETMVLYGSNFVVIRNYRHQNRLRIAVFTTIQHNIQYFPFDEEQQEQQDNE